MPDGCRCRECFGLAEYMERLTGSDHGLPHAPGHPGLHHGFASELRQRTHLTKAQFDAIQEAKRAAGVRAEPAQPWVPKPPRQRRSAA